MANNDITISSQKISMFKRFRDSLQQGIYFVINPFVRFMIRIGITPNMVTTIGLLGNIAAAVIYGCDCIISWNFKHIVNIKTIRGIRAITNLRGYKPVEIINPSVLLESEV